MLDAPVIIPVVTVDASTVLLAGVTTDIVINEGDITVVVIGVKATSAAAPIVTDATVTVSS